MVVLVFLPFILGRWASAYQRHVASQDIEELGEFIQAAGPDLFSDAGDLFSVHNLVSDDSRVEVQLEHHAIGNPVLGHEVLLPFLRVHVHGADLVALEALAVEPDSCLLEEDGTGTLLFDFRPDDRDDQQSQDAAGQTAQDVKDPLDDQLPGAGVIGGHGQDVVSADLLNEALAAGAGDGEADMDRDSHFPALFHQPAHAGLASGLFHFVRDLAAVCIVNEILHGFIGGHLQVGEVFRVNEDFVHPFPADIVRGVLQTGYDFYPVEYFPGGVPVAEDNAGIFKSIHAAGPVQDPVNGAFVRHQDHDAFSFSFTNFADQRFPEETDQVTQNQMEAGGQVDGDTGIGIAGLGGEEVQGHEEENQGHVLDGGCQFLELAPLHDVVHGAEDNGYQHIHYRQDDGQGTVGFLEIGPVAPSVTDHIAKDKGSLQDDNIPEDKIDMLQPALYTPLVHLNPTFTVVFFYVWILLLSIPFRVQMETGRKDNVFLCLCHPQAMEVAVLIGRDDGLRDGEVGFRLLAGLQVLLLETGGGFQEDPLDVMGFQHGVFHGSDFDDHMISLVLDDGYVFLVGTVGGVGEDFFSDGSGGGNDFSVMLVEFHCRTPFITSIIRYTFPLDSQFDKSSYIELCISSLFALLVETISTKFVFHVIRHSISDSDFLAVQESSFLPDPFQ